MLTLYAPRDQGYHKGGATEYSQRQKGAGSTEWSAHEFLQQRIIAVSISVGVLYAHIPKRYHGCDFSHLLTALGMGHAVDSPPSFVRSYIRPQHSYNLRTCISHLDGSNVCLFKHPWRSQAVPAPRVSVPFTVQGKGEKSTPAHLRLDTHLISRSELSADEHTVMWSRSRNALTPESY